MSVYQAANYYATCDTIYCTETIGKGEDLTDWELSQRLIDEGWEIDGNVFDGLTYCPKHAEDTE